MTENDQKEIKKTRQENLDRLKKKLNEAKLFLSMNKKWTRWIESRGRS